VDILTAFVGLLLVTVSAIASFTDHRNRQAILSLSDDLIAQTADATVEKATAYFAPAAAMAQSCAGVAAETLAAGKDLFGLEAYAIQTVQSYPQFAMLNMGDQRGNFLMPKKLPDGTIATKIIRATDKPPTVTWKYRDAAGRVVRIETSENTDYDPRVRAWYTGAKAAGTHHWTDTYVFFTDRRPGITASYPVLSRDGALLGVVGLDIELARLSRFLASLRIGKNGVAFIVDTKGDVVAYPHAGSAVVDGAQGPRAARLDEIAAPWVAASMAEYRRTGRAKFTFTHQRRRYIASYTPLPTSANPAWTIAVVVPESDFTGPLQAANRGVLVLSLVVLLGAVIAATFIARSISDPVRKLSEATARIRDFDLTGDTPVSSRIREVQLMESAVSAMRTGLRSFQKYVPAALVRQLIETGEDARLGGQTRELTLVFSDVNDFTGRCEGLAPQQLMLHLSEYLDELTRLIIANHGTVDKYVGDGVMAFWGAPMRDADHAAHACRAALACRARIEELNRVWEARGQVSFPTRWGIHTGETVVGNMGSAERMSYSAVGDSVNLASRLETVNKVYSTSVVMSEVTALRAGEAFVCRPLGVVAVKGKQQSVRVFELMREATDPLAHEAKRLAQLFTRGVDLYERGDWTGAAKAFEATRAAFPSDAPTATYLRWCHDLIASPPGPDWDGVLRLDHK
jgi:adenylate cyclase